MRIRLFRHRSPRKLTQSNGFLQESMHFRSQTYVAEAIALITIYSAVARDALFCRLWGADIAFAVDARPIKTARSTFAGSEHVACSVDAF